MMSHPKKSFWARTVKREDADTVIGDIKEAAGCQALLPVSARVSTRTPAALLGALLCPHLALGESRGLVQCQGGDRTRAS